MSKNLIKKEKLYLKNKLKLQNQSVKPLPQKLKFKPREKSDLIGFESLSNEELISLIIGHGGKNYPVYDIASRVGKVLNSYKSGEISVNEVEATIQGVKGIGYSKGKTLLAAIELSKRLYISREYVFNSPEKIVAMCLSLRQSRQEKVMSIFLSSGMQMIHRKQSFCGTVDKTLISPREIFLAALKVQARYIVLAHNHPSGNPLPSEADILETRRIKEVGEILGIDLLDHIIVTKDSYYSFKEKGVLS